MGRLSLWGTSTLVLEISRSLCMTAQRMCSVPSGLIRFRSVFTEYQSTPWGPPQLMVNTSCSQGNFTSKAKCWFIGVSDLFESVGIQIDHQKVETSIHIQHTALRMLFPVLPTRVKPNAGSQGSMTFSNQQVFRQIVFLRFGIHQMLSVISYLLDMS